MKGLPANEAFHPFTKEERRGEDENKQLNLIYESNGEGTYFVSNRIKFLCDDFQPYKAEDSWKIAALLCALFLSLGLSFHPVPRFHNNNMILCLILLSTTTSALRFKIFNYCSEMQR